MRADDVIAALHLSPLPWEGGYYRETWRSDVDIPAPVLPDAYDASRNAGTAIYYLLTPDTVSRFHRLPSDEVFHFYLGDVVEVISLRGQGMHVDRLGHDILGADVVQLIIPGNTWFGARLADGGETGFALMGTTVSPGFDFDDLEMGEADALIAAHPNASDIIRALA